MDSQPKPSLAELLALEEVKEAGLPTDITAVSSAPAEPSVTGPTADSIAITDTGAITTPTTETPSSSETPEIGAITSTTEQSSDEKPAEEPKKPTDFNPHDISL
jgi:hypothetical protein